MSYRIPLAQRVNNSTMIIKGKVKEQPPYKSKDGNIYTLNKIEISAF
ncbi:MAG TPA: hypothetical protein PLS10_08235 [Chitinophagales bacterium]|nr:hypothetical protein [Chitinophagales bacterium]